MRSSRRPRTKQRPRWPSRSLQKRGQTSHCTRPSAEHVPVAAGNAFQCRVVGHRMLTGAIGTPCSPNRPNIVHDRPRWQGRSIPRARGVAARGRPAARRGAHAAAPRRSRGDRAACRLRLFRRGGGGGVRRGARRRAGPARVLIGPSHYVRFRGMAAPSLRRRSPRRSARVPVDRGGARRWSRPGSPDR